MSPTNLLGWCASALMLACQFKGTLWCIKALAVAANLAFIVYAWQADVPHVLALHLAPLPINTSQLIAALRERIGRRSSPDADVIHARVNDARWVCR